MWPLSLVLFSAIAAQPQQNPTPDFKADISKLRVQMQRQGPAFLQKRLDAQQNDNVCYFIRSYHFRRQDGLAPVPAGVTTCTPANAFRQKQVSKPGPLLVPLTMQQDQEDDQKR